MLRAYRYKGSMKLPMSSTCLLWSVIHNNQTAFVQVNGNISKCTVRQSYRYYTPIFQPEPVTDNVARVRASDEANVLWTVTPTVDSLPRAVEVWLRFGNDPVMHTSVPPQLPRSPGASGNANEIMNEQSVDSDNKTQTPSSLHSSCSPFAYAEDYMGTNLVSGSSEQLRESTALWNDYFEHKYTSHMRQSRRTATNYIGLSTAADVFNDEADSPNTTWSQDIVFQELSYLSQKFLKIKVTDMLEFEHALWFSSTAENFLHFFDNYQQQTFTRIPLPSPSVWVYEGAARKQWVENYLPASHASRMFFDSKINPALVSHTHGSRASEQLLQKVADALERVHEIELRRAERQIREAIRPTWTSRDDTVKSKSRESEDEATSGNISESIVSDADEKQSHSEEMDVLRRAWTDNEMERYQRAIQEGTYDPEDLLDTSESWKEEHQAIEQVMQENIDGYSFTLHDFWLHCIRREELETMHVWDNDRLRGIAAIARFTLYHELTLAEMYKDVRESLCKGQIDVRAAVFKPFVNHTYCKLHYAKFGASSMVQHTQTASRQLLFHQSASIYEVRATANLYFASKPLSSHLDYSSPYMLRRSWSKLCATYGIDGMFAQQRPVLLSCAYLAKAEHLIQQVKCEVERVRGEQRRRRIVMDGQEPYKLSAQPVAFPLTDVRVVDLQSELLDRGESMDRVTASTSVLLTQVHDADSHGNSNNNNFTNSKSKQEERSTMWPLGSRKAICYHWPIPQLEKIKFVKQAGSYLTAARAKELEELKQSAHLEISLWRRRTHEELEAMRLQSANRTAQVNALIQRIPELAEVKNYIESFYDEVSVITTRTVEKNSSDDNTNGFNKEKKAEEQVKNDTDSDTDKIEEEWEFAVMLDDYALLNEDEVSIVYLPYIGANGKVLPQGEYKVCIRAFNTSSTSSSALGIPPTPYDVSFSQSFPVFDAVPQLCEQFCQEHHLSSEQVTSSESNKTAKSNSGNNNNSQSAKTEDGSNINSKSSTEAFTLANFTLLPGELLIPFCEFLRDAGLDVPLRTEFMAGQVLDTHGNVFVHAFLERLRGSQDHQSLADAHLTEAQRDIEIHCRAHWQLYWPGANDVEWSRVRRSVLNDAIMEERDWWLPDPLLTLDNEMCACDTTQSTNTLMYRASMRYAHELCQALKARGSSWHRNKIMCTEYPTTRALNKNNHEEQQEEEKEKKKTLEERENFSETQEQLKASCAKQIEASCTVDGTGAVCQLTFHKCDKSNSTNYNSNPYRQSIYKQEHDNNKKSTTQQTTSEMSCALNAALMAIQDAHNRHCTLATCKMAPFEKYTQMLRFCEADLTSCGGKYARTYAYAFGKAQAAALQIEEQGRIQPGSEEKDTIRLSEMTQVDRFASTTHPEQRKKLFYKEFTLAGDDLDDPAPDLTSTWNR